MQKNIDYLDVDWGVNQNKYFKYGLYEFSVQLILD